MRATRKAKIIQERSKWIGTIRWENGSFLVCKKLIRNAPFFSSLEETGRKRKHHFMFRSKSSDKSKEAKGESSFLVYCHASHQGSISSLEAKANGNVFGVALAQCVLDDDCRCQDETHPASPPASTTASSPGGGAAPAATASGTSRKDSTDLFAMRNNDKRTSPSGSISSTNDSGYSVSPASPSSLHVSWRMFWWNCRDSQLIFRYSIMITNNRRSDRSRSNGWKAMNPEWALLDATPWDAIQRKYPN